MEVFVRKDWILVTIVALILVVGLGLIGYLKLSNKSINPNPEASQEIAGAQKDQTTYFSQEASVMYFYSDLCHWCQKQKQVLEEIANEGYQVKPMDVGTNPDFWQEYKIEGTPTFVAQNGDKLVGYKDKDTLKTWLDEHK